MLNFLSVGICDSPPGKPILKPPTLPFGILLLPHKLVSQSSPINAGDRKSKHHTPRNMSSMDLDDLDGPIQAPTKKRPSRFLSKSSKLKPEPKPKPEPQELNDALPVFKKKEEVVDTKPVISDFFDGDSTAAANGAVKMEVEEPKEDPMNVDEGGEDYVVREIDVYFMPTVDANTQVSDHNLFGCRENHRDN